jgi:hypothetical protein
LSGSPRIFVFAKRMEHEQPTIGTVCGKREPLSRADCETLASFAHRLGERTLELIPHDLAGDNVGIVFGTLLKALPDWLVFEAAARYCTRATDVLRMIAVYSDADPALDGELITVTGADGKCTELRVRRFKVRPLRRRVRHQLFSLLESFGAEALRTDMLRHRSYWVWLGELLHPYEQARKFPGVAAAFSAVRRSPVMPPR